GFQHGPVSRTERLHWTGRLQQLEQMFFGEEMGQVLVLAGGADAVGRVALQNTLPAKELEPRPQGRQPSGGRRLRILLVVQPGKEKGRQGDNRFSWSPCLPFSLSPTSARRSAMKSD